MVSGFTQYFNWFHILPIISVPYIISLVFLAVFSSVLCLLPWKPLQDFFTVSLFLSKRFCSVTSRGSANQLASVKFPGKECALSAGNFPSLLAEIIVWYT